MSMLTPVLSFWHDLRSGRLGAGLRIGLSLATAILCVAGMLLVLGVVEMSGGYMTDAKIAVGVALAAVAWCGTLIVIWSTARRWGWIARPLIVVIGAWVVAICLSVMIISMNRRAEVFITGLMFVAAAVTALAVLWSIYRRRAGRPMHEPAGQVAVACPECAYSMVGLDTCTCPECGHRSTIDRLILAQNYGVVNEMSRDRPPWSPSLPPGASSAPRPASDSGTGPESGSVPGATMPPDPSTA